jgi:lipopolysaccharide/colanic/teichoic acid biosynthesis glycosyltransferase
VLGGTTGLARVVAEHGVTRVLVATPAVEDAGLVRLLRTAAGLPVEVYLLPRLPELGAGLPHGYLDEVWGVPLVPLRGERRVARSVTAAAQRVAAVAMLVLAAPLLLLLAAAVRVADGVPVLFGQARAVGTGRLATVRKLRTMAEHADSDTRWSVSPADCTRLGGWLRATHLDELPQLVNVVRGEMALVGPRPERPRFAAAFGRVIPHYDDRHRVRSGMTGWAQVHGLHGDSSIADRARFDNQYIEYWSPWLDVVILVRTLAAVLRGAAAARRGAVR